MDKEKKSKKFKDSLEQHTYAKFCLHLFVKLTLSFKTTDKNTAKLTIIEYKI